MLAPDPADRAYCVDLVKANDEDLALALNYVGPAARPRVEALYALAVELRRVPQAVREPPIGEIRLQWWRDALDEARAAAGGGDVRAHPTVRLLAASGAVDARVRDIAEAGVDARARLLYGEPFAGADELRVFFANAEGWLAAALSTSDPDAARAAAADYALARWGRTLVTTLDLGEAPRRAPPSACADEAASLAYVALARGYAKRAAGAPWPALKRLTLLRAVAFGPHA
ncbi:MAG: squalene/phytoene synthase family protein [Parvularculaceae bacterium]